MKKQYSYDEVYKDNYEVVTYEDGIITGSEIVSVGELSFYLERLENDGYEFCYSDFYYVKIQSQLSMLTTLMQDMERKRLYHKE